MVKKGIIFSLEAIFAVSFFMSIFAFLLILNIENISPYKRFERLNLLAKDSLEVISKTKVKDVLDSSSILKEQLDAGKIKEDDTIIEAIGTFWAQGDTNIARNIAKEIFSKIVPNQIKYKLSIDGIDLYSSGILSSETSEVSQSSKIVSGFQPGKLSKGFSARAFLEKIKSKTFSSYSYFGGFVGQGNITFFINDISSDAIIRDFYIEASFGSNFSLYVNNFHCGIFNKTASGAFPVDSWTINDKKCLDEIKTGNQNKFNINFTDTNITYQFIGGGYAKVTYDTNQLSSNIPTNIKNGLPGINGIINLYDSFYVPGKLKTMNISLNFSSYEKIFVNVGNKTIYFGNESVVITNDTLSTLLNYGKLSQQTVPFRIGHFQLNASGEGFDTDVILTTSLVKGMNNKDVPTDSDTITRIDAAKRLDKIFVDIVLGFLGNNVGLQAYHSSAPSGQGFAEAPTTNSIKLKTEIDGYKAQTGIGERCICCAIHQATELLTNPTARNFIILMSDGDAAKVAGQCPNAQTSDPRQAAINEACHAYNSLDIRVYTIGFGVEANNDLLKQIATCGGGEWRASTDFNGLKDIYQQFANEISKKSIVYKFQPVVPTGVNSSLSTDSNIETEYELEVPQPEFGSISLKFETQPFSSNAGCFGSFFIPKQLTVSDMRVTSYSSDFWTKQLSFNNSAYSSVTAFNLSNVGDQFPNIGDPFNVQIPANFIRSNEFNNISLILGASPTNQTNTCSLNNRAIYTASLSASTNFSPVLPKATGNIFRVYFNRGGFDCEPEGSTLVEVGYPIESPTPLEIGDINPTNAVHFVFAELLDKLNSKGTTCSGPSGSKTNPIDIEITPELKVAISSISNVPSLWGPLKFTLVTWT